MLFRKKRDLRSNLDRLLCEFPWLWALKVRWSEETRVSVGQGTTHLFKFGFMGRRFEGVRAWIVSRSSDVESIDPLSFEGNILFTERMLNALPDSDFQITHVVIMQPDGLQVEIFRVPDYFNAEHARSYIGNYDTR